MILEALLVINLVVQLVILLVSLVLRRAQRRFFEAQQRLNELTHQRLTGLEAHVLGPPKGMDRSITLRPGESVRQFRRGKDGKS
jgi:hypothetical protein